MASESFEFAHYLFLLVLILLSSNSIGVIELIEQTHCLYLPVHIFEIFIIILLNLTIGDCLLLLKFFDSLFVFLLYNLQ